MSKTLGQQLYEARREYKIKKGIYSFLWKELSKEVQEEYKKLAKTATGKADLAFYINVLRKPSRRYLNKENNEIGVVPNKSLPQVFDVAATLIPPNW